MTEKRFEIVKLSELEYGIKIDNECLIGLSFDRITAEYLVKQWNNLNIQNEKLKKENRELLDELVEAKIELSNIKSEKLNEV